MTGACTIHVATQVAHIATARVGAVAKATRSVLRQMAVKGIPRGRGNKRTMLHGEGGSDIVRECQLDECVCACSQVCARVMRNIFCLHVINESKSYAMYTGAYDCR